MKLPILGLHHVTATVTDAHEDLNFYRKLLGLRLVKKTVNFDNHNVYHFYYGNASGSPSTIMTTFPYTGWGVPIGTKGAGQITVTAFSVPASSLAFWRSRLAAAGVATVEQATSFGEDALAFDDPSGLRITLVGTAGDDREPWITQEIADANAIRGIHSVALSIRSPAATIALLTDVLGFDVVTEAGDVTRVGVNGGGPGRSLEVAHTPDAPAAVNGLGTVHHVALAIADEGQQLHAREALLELGLKVTEVRDRQYFRSIYFREPGGVLYEIATVGPGFAIDEAPERLGCDLKLPPWEEPHRESIEANLPAI